MIHLCEIHVGGYAREHEQCAASSDFEQMGDNGLVADHNCVGERFEIGYRVQALHARPARHRKDCNRPEGKCSVGELDKLTFIAV